MNKKIKRIEKIVVTLSIVFTLFFTSLLVFAKWPRWWEYVIFERTPMTWFESVLLFLIFTTAISCSIINYLDNKKLHTKLWLLVSSGFFYLMLDERFAIHERIRDKILAPNNINLPIFFWTSAGDYVLILIFIPVLFLVPSIVKMLKERKSSLYLFISAIITTGISISFDSIDVKHLSIHIQRIQQFSEEIIETSGMLMFFLSFFLILMFQLDKMIGEKIKN